jgi:hypothetical protein
MDMDSWLHGYATTNAAGNNGFMCGYAASRYALICFSWLKQLMMSVLALSLFLVTC